MRMNSDYPPIQPYSSGNPDDAKAQWLRRGASCPSYCRTAQSIRRVSRRPTGQGRRVSPAIRPSKDVVGRSPIVPDVWRYNVFMCTKNAPVIEPLTGDEGTRLPNSQYIDVDAAAAVGKPGDYSSPRARASMKPTRMAARPSYAAPPRGWLRPYRRCHRRLCA